MYEQLTEFHTRPAPFSRYTADTLWTDAHIAQRMLDYHLDPAHDIASRKPGSIQRIAGWIDRRIGLQGKSVCDLGCGPGLYARDFARRGATVTGCDFSETSLAHARACAGAGGLDIAFVRLDYLADPLPGNQDLIVLIYGDICALSPAQRRTLLAKVHSALKPGGRFVLDAFAKAQFAGLEEKTGFGFRLMDGFWSADDYFGFSKTFLYAEESLALDRYLIVEPDRSFEVFNWLRYFEPEELEAELRGSGFEVGDPVDAVTGDRWKDAEAMFSIIASRPG